MLPIWVSLSKPHGCSGVESCVVILFGNARSCQASHQQRVPQAMGLAHFLATFCAFILNAKVRPELPSAHNWREQMSLGTRPRSLRARNTRRGTTTSVATEAPLLRGPSRHRWPPSGASSRGSPVLQILPTPRRGGLGGPAGERGASGEPRASCVCVCVSERAAGARPDRLEGSSAQIGAEELSPTSEPGATADRAAGRPQAPALRRTLSWGPGASSPPAGPSFAKPHATTSHTDPSSQTQGHTGELFVDPCHGTDEVGQPQWPTSCAGCASHARYKPAPHQAMSMWSSVSVSAPTGVPPTPSLWTGTRRPALPLSTTLTKVDDPQATLPPSNPGHCSTPLSQSGPRAHNVARGMCRRTSAGVLRSAPTGLFAKELA